MKQLLLAAILALFGLQALAIDKAPAFEDPVQQARYERLARELRCLQCRSETIADSNAQLAADLRRQLRELMAAGKSDQEIMQYMTDRYGDYVLYKPPVAPRTWLLWAAPALLVIGGGIVAAIVISRKSKLPDTDPADPGLGAS
ncbi:cytochrome c-type biogenesis protein [Steroidobacter agaridevorans]|uniref:cytochrome c-type biogenesis protein n=1 Tax=Steroidobacter agaridevorans TaxID=2695856 RepID=UPI001327C9DF|nr:cytochrome c-type biogenesis protein [Steroidobacter agaridevorans]GFE86717.1 cytochrome c biogenesis protein [Steroidobacter agaridevorans]